MKRFTYILSLFLVVAACSHDKTDTPEVVVSDSLPVMVMRIQQCSKLYTAEFRVHKIITHDDQMKLSGSFMKKDFSVNLPVGDRIIAIPMDATIKGYIDFSRFSKENIHKDGDKIHVTLPDPKIELTSTKINNSEIKQHVDLIRQNFSDKELSSYEQQGRRQIIESIPQMGIVENARQSAVRTLVPMLTAMGYKEENITIDFRKGFNVNDIKSILNTNSTKRS